ncbi:MAG: hypothetical protein RLZZ238_1981 [Planctomycetota bacterium]
MSGDRVPGDARGIRTAALGAAAVHAIVAGAAILAGIEGTSEWFDQKDYHLPVIERFAAELPAPVLSDYRSATTPLYHLLMAVFERVGAGGLVLHAVNLAFGIALVAVFTRFVARRTGVLPALAAGCMLGLSPYVLSSSVWLTTDNLASLLLVLAFASSAGIACGCARMPVRCGAWAALWSLLAAGVRQIMLYTAAFPAAAVVARACAERRLPAIGSIAAASLAIVPSAALVAAFVVAWGGLVPPSFREYHGGGANPATAPYVLALVAIWGSAAFCAVPGFVRGLFAPRALIAAGLALVAACAVPTNYVVHVRFGGVLWSVAARLPAPFERSLLIVPLAAVGAAAIVSYLSVWSRSDDRAGRGVGAFALLALFGMTLAQTANSQCFERYMQPLVVVFCTIAAAAIAGRNARAWPFAVAAAVAHGLSAFNVFRLGG